MAGLRKTLNSFLTGLIRVMPDGLSTRLLPQKSRYAADQMLVVKPPATPVRVLIAPANFAGQGYQWARAIERNLEGVGAVSMAVRSADEVFHFPVDVSVPASGSAFSGSWQRREYNAVRTGFSHVVVEAERHLFGRYGQTVEHQVRSLTAAGVSVAMLCHGSDIRLPSRHAAMEEHSPFSTGRNSELTAALEQQARRNRELLDRLRLPVFVSTPGLLDDVPWAAWLPVVVTPSLWQGARPPLVRERPVVAHAPSKGVMKGSEMIDPVLQKMHESGVIEYLRVEGRASAEMPDIYRSADIVVDQLLLGDYGVAACEALAAGRLVVGHVSPLIRDQVERASGLSLPIVEASVDSFEATLVAILAQRESYRARAAEGPAFVDHVHDGRKSAEVLRGFLTGRSAV